MKIFSRKNFLYVTAVFSGLGFVYTAFSAPPGSPYNPGETLTPTCAPGDANCSVTTPHYNGVAEAWIGATESASQNTNGKTLRNFHVENTDTSTTTGNAALTMVDTYVEPTSNHAAGAKRQAFAGYQTIPATNTSDIQGIAGVEGGAVNYSTVSIHQAMNGLVGWGYNAANATFIDHIFGTWTGVESDAGTVDELVGIESWNGVYGGTVSHSKAINIIMDNTGGTVTNRYAMFIETPIGSATNEYGIYQQGGVGVNYFNADIGIGTTSPDAGLEVDRDTTTFPDGWADNLKVHSAQYPAIWYQAETANEGWILGSDQGDDFSYMTTDGTSAGDYLIKFEQNGQYLFNYSQADFFDEELHIAMEAGGSSDTAISIENSNSGSDYVFEIHVEDTNEFVIYEGNSENSSNSVLMYNGATNHWGFGTDPTANELQMDSGAHITAGGVFTDASSREYKTGIRSLTYEEAYDAFNELNPVSFEYKEQPGEQYLGFIAEDVPDLVATADRKGLSSMDIVAVLVEVNKKQQEDIEALKAIVCLDHPSAELCS